MSSAEQWPDLASLSSAEKDELIRALWAELPDHRAQRTSPVESRRNIGAESKRPLLEQLKRHGARKRGSTPASSNVEVRLGSRLGFLRSGLVIGVFGLAGLVIATDQGIGWYQDNRLQQKRLATLALQHAAFSDLLVELVRVTYEPDQRSYRLTMAMKNLDPVQPIYVMTSPVRVFVQSGLVWKEIPARAGNGRAAGVVKLTDQHAYETIFEPNLKDWTELMPGYMHVRFESNRLISRRSEPDDDIVERSDRNYVYLKPHGADDEAIRARMKYQDKPPVYIPMPPH
jgi:hypothetical protein